MLEATALPTEAQPLPASSIVFFLKNGPSSASFSFIFVIKQILQFLQQNICEFFYDHPVYSAGIQTHDLRNMSLLP